MEEAVSKHRGERRLIPQVITEQVELEEAEPKPVIFWELNEAKAEERTHVVLPLRTRVKGKVACSDGKITLTYLTIWGEEEPERNVLESLKIEFPEEECSIWKKK